MGNSCNGIKSIYIGCNNSNKQIFNTLQMEEMKDIEINRWLDKGYVLFPNGRIYDKNLIVIGKADFWHEALPFIIENERNNKINDILNDKED